MLPPIRIHHPHVESRPDLLGGSPMVRGSKVPVRRLWAWHRKGVTIETLVRRYPALGAAKVLDAMAFAYDNEDVVEADLQRERDMLESEERAPMPPPAKRREPLIVEVPPRHIAMHRAGLQPNGEPLPSDRSDDEALIPHCTYVTNGHPSFVCVLPADHPDSAFGGHHLVRADLKDEIAQLRLEHCGPDPGAP